MSKDKQMEIYKDFIRARVGEVTMAEVVLKHGISRQAIYKSANLVFAGNAKDYKVAEQNLRWKYIYSPTYEVIKGLKNDPQKKMFSYILKQMVEEGFTISDIARVMKRGSGDRKIIYQYLKS